MIQEEKPRYEELEIRVAELEHVLRVSGAARELGRLQSQTKERDLFMQDACSTLVKTGDYYNAWIALFDATGDLITWAETGWGQDFLPMVEKLKNKETFPCKDRVWNPLGFLVTYEPSSRCTGCPLSNRAPECAAMSAALKHENSIFGLMTVSLPKLFATSKDAHAVFQEITADIASALLRSGQGQASQNRLNTSTQVGDWDCLVYGIVSGTWGQNTYPV